MNAPLNQRSTAVQVSSLGTLELQMVRILRMNFMVTYSNTIACSNIPTLSMENSLYGARIEIQKQMNEVMFNDTAKTLPTRDGIDVGVPRPNDSSAWVDVITTDSNIENGMSMFAAQLWAAKKAKFKANVTANINDTIAKPGFPKV